MRGAGLLNRRRFITAAIIAALGLRIPPASSEEDPGRRLVLRILNARAREIAVEDADRGRFAADYLAERGWMVAEVLRTTSFLRFYDTFLFSVLAGTSDQARLRELERDVVTAFLLSSDFFVRDARPLGYRGWNNTACANPFARFD